MGCLGLTFLGLTLAAKAQDHHHPPQDVLLHEKFYSTWYMPETRARVAATSKTATQPKSNTLGRVCSLGGAKTGHGWSFQRKKSSAIETIRMAAITSACHRRTIPKQARCSAFLSVEEFDTNRPTQVQTRRSSIGFVTSRSPAKHPTELDTVRISFDQPSENSDKPTTDRGLHHWRRFRAQRRIGLCRSVQHPDRTI
jgi:hypothetical protein